MSYTQNTDAKIACDELLRLIQNSRILQQMPESQRQNFILKIFNTTEENKLILYRFLIEESQVINDFNSQKNQQKSAIFKKYISKFKVLLAKGSKLVLSTKEQKDKAKETQNLEMLLNEV